MPITIRRAVPADGPGYVALVRALAEFEQLPGPDDEAARRLVDDAFGERPRYELWIGERDGERGGEIVAYAVTFETYSTFLARPTLFLEDLFVHPRARREGIAKAMLARLKDEAVKRGCGRFEWMVLDWNEGAQGLYRGIGAREEEAWRLWRVQIGQGQGQG